MIFLSYVRNASMTLLLVSGCGLLSLHDFNQLSAQGIADRVPQNIGNTIQQDTAYVKSMRKHFALRFYNIIKTTDFSVRNNELNQSFRFRPNNGLGVGLGFSYKILALDIGFVIPGTMRYQGDDPTTKFDLLSTLYGKRHIFDATLQYYEGYFFDNAGDHFPPNQLDQYRNIRTDISSVDLALSYLYVMNYDQFSFQAAFLGDVIQRQSAGSPTFHGFVSLFGLQADSALIRHDFGNGLNEQAYITEVGLLSTGTGVGYAHTFVLPKNFFITLSGAPLVMISGSFSEINHPDFEDLSAGSANIRLFTRSAVGYNARRFYLIFNAIYDNYFVRFGNVSRIDYAPLKLKLFFGYRFGKI